MNNQMTETVEMVDDGIITGITDDEDDDAPSSPESAYNDNDLMHVAMEDEVTAQLAAAGPVGVAAAAAIASAKKRKRPHSFETNPSIRKRQQNRLLRKLSHTIFEFTTRVGQQAIVLVATPGKPNTSYKVFGAKPLEDVVKNLKSIVMEELESALAQQAPPPPQEDPTLFELPPLIIDGIPTPVEKMTQAQLRAFIPLMLKYSTGRGKPGWGRESTRPAWWPTELPWANVRMDARTEDEKQKIGWTHALRKIVVNCYKFHGREDLLPAFSEEDEKANQIATSNSSVISSNLHTTNDGSGTVHTVQGIDSNGHSENMTVDLTEATLAQDGQLIITGEDGQGYPVSVSGMITLPVSSSVYQTMVANIQHLQTNSDGTLCLTPMQVQKGPTGGSISSTSGSCNSPMRICRAVITNNSDAIVKQFNKIHHNNNNNVVRANHLNHMPNITTNIGQSHTNNLNSHNNNNNNNNNIINTTNTNTNTNNNNNNNNNNTNLSKYVATLPKIEHADANHSRAIIDNDGNITIHLGDAEAIKLECETES